MKKFLIGSAIFIVIIVALVSWGNRVTHLDQPVVKVEKTLVSSEVPVSGLGYPGARIAIYVEDQFVQDLPVSPDGTFQGKIILKEEGPKELKAKQVYKNISSEFSEAIHLQVDLMPPDKSSFVLNTKIPEFTKETSLTFEGKANPGDIVLVKTMPYAVNEEGVFSGTFLLLNGENTLNFSLSDEAGNLVLVETHKIIVDSLPPKIGTTWCTSKPSTSNSLASLDINNLKPGEEYVCVSTGQWQDWQDPAPVPIVGYIVGDVASITVNGKKITPDENDEIYQRIMLPVPKGLNKYKVVATDKYGNQSTANISMTVESVRDSEDDEVLDRLDDIESQIYDLQ